jgi:hypothetical protein
MSTGKESKPLVYIPDGAKINVRNDNLAPPKTKYDERQVVFPRDDVKKQITKKDVT